MEIIKRPRRLRSNEVLRKMVRETRMDRSSLIYPIFIAEGENIKEEISSMPGQYRYSLDRMGEKLAELAEAGVQRGLCRRRDSPACIGTCKEGISSDVSDRRLVHVRIYVARALRHFIRGERGQ